MQNDGKIPQSLSMMGIKVTPFDSYDHALECISNRIAERKKTLCIAINPIKVYKAKQNTELLVTLSNKADICLCDGIGIVYALRLLSEQRVRRCTGVQLFFNIIERACQTGWKIFFLGASQKSNELACLRLRQEYPSLRIVGQHHGYFKDDDAIIEQINSSRANVIFAAMGSPLQEEWLGKHKDSINASLLMGIGGTLDVVSGHTKWAPKFFRKTGTEFLYRLMKEPHRGKRQLALLKFSTMVFRAIFVSDDTYVQDPFDIKIDRLE